MSRPRTRRRFLTATAAVLGSLGLASTTGADDHRSFVLEQDGDCVPVVPLSGEAPVEEFYRWGRSIGSYSSNGTRELQRSETSLLFLYRGPEGLSLVVIHDKLDDKTPGGTVSFDIQGIPSSATWAVKDDLYDASSNVDIWKQNGTELEANETTITQNYNVSDYDNDTDYNGNHTDYNGNDTDYDNDTDYNGNDTDYDNDTDYNGNHTDYNNDTDYDHNHTDYNNGTDYDHNHTDYDNETVERTRTDEVDWWWTTGRTDGGAIRGLAVDDLELRIEPAFNDEAELADSQNEGKITSWEVLSGDLEEPDRTELVLDEPVILRTGSCDETVEESDDSNDGSDSNEETTTESDNDEETTTENDSDEETTTESDNDEETTTENDSDEDSE